MQKLGALGCDRCPTVDACGKLALERIESDPNVSAAHAAFMDYADGKAAPFQRSGHLRPWRAFLAAIKRHGGWEDVNDARVAADNLRKESLARANEKRRNQDRAASRKAERKAWRAASLPPKQPITHEWLALLEGERERRLKVLLDLRQFGGATRTIARLTPEGCERTADVWMAREYLKRTGVKLTAKGLAEWLALNDRGQGFEVTTLTTQASRSLKRIEDLEREVAGASIWPRPIWNP